MTSQCPAEYHSKDGKDSLIHSSHTLFCMKKKGHDGKHEYYGIGESVEDNSVFCNCPRCNDPKLKEQKDHDDAISNIAKNTIEELNEKSYSDLEPLGIFIVKHVFDDSNLSELITELLQKHGETALNFIDVTKTIYKSTNKELEKVIGGWYAYLRKNMICPDCKNRLESSDECECGWHTK